MEMNKNKIVKKIRKALTFCLCCILLGGVLFIVPLTVFGADEPSEGGGSARITDLTGYTVTVPAGWSATSSYGSYSLYCSFPADAVYEEFITLRIGYAFIGDYVTTANSVTFGGEAFRQYNSTQSFTFTIHGGSGVTNSRLIQWLYDNNATFVNNNVAVTGWSVDETINVFITPIVQTTPPTVNDYQTIYYYGGWNKPYAILRDRLSVDGELFLPTVYYYDTFYEALYYGFEESVRTDLAESVYNAGFDVGYDVGYQSGLAVGESSTIGKNLIGSGFTAITDSLNHIILYQSSTGTVVTLWVVVCGAIGIALFIWVLKLFAGG